MTILAAADARKKFFTFIDDVVEFHEPIQETIYLESFPNMCESIIKGLNTPVKK